MRQLTDTHCHLNLPHFLADIEEVLERAWEKGLQRILVPGTNVETSRIAVRLADQNANVYAAVGVHPGDAQSWDEDTPGIIRELAQHPKTVAIGEIGLDYFRDRSPREVQRDVFRAQLDLAGEQGLPVIIHNRDAFNDVWTELDAWTDEITRNGAPIAKRPGVLHSFDGSLINAQQAVDKGFTIGISGPVTFHNARERQRTTALLPLDCLVIETDAPFLTPHPHRGQRNEPAYVALVAEKISELHNIDQELAAQVTGLNAVKLFDWGANP